MEKMMGVVQRKKEDLPLFSLIILTYYQQHLIFECLDTILEQNYPNIEIVICDDHSADFNREEIQNYIEDNKNSNIKNVIIFQQYENVGTTANAKKGVELSGGVYFKLHAGDDMLYEKSSLRTMEKHLCKPDVNLVAARSIACLKDGAMTETAFPAHEDTLAMMNAKTAQEQFDLIASESWGKYVNAPAVFWKRAFYDKMGGFDLSYKYTEDWPMWLKITKAGYRLEAVNVLTTIYRYGGISNDQSDLNQVLGRLHYLECIQMMQEYVLPEYIAQNNRKKIIRCKHCIRCIEARICSEGQWLNMRWGEKLSWRIRHIKHFFVAWLYRKRIHGAMPLSHYHGLFKWIGIFFVMYVLHVEPIPGKPFDYIWAVLFCIYTTWLSINLAGNLAIRMFKIGMDRKGGK